MRQSLQIDMLVKSENLIRGVNPMAIYGMHQKQREKVAKLLTTHIVKPPEVDGMLRRFGTSVRGLGPGAGPRLIFERVEHEDPALGGVCWLYMPVEHEGNTTISTPRG